ncbi:MAG: SEC-C metal-binding domain-containing protein [Deltaproteobacteria bacterium]|nr:SEC-C metal-binding domain-containing protein [Deltaproteobacteria bacterium]
MPRVRVTPGAPPFNATSQIDLEPDKPEEITALEVLLNTPETKIAEKKIGRNALCPCGSGQKHKGCCGR